MTTRDTVKIPTLSALTAVIILAVLTTPTFPQGGPEAPPGPPGPVMKSLEQIEPRTPLVEGAIGVDIAANGTIKINKPGSYYLTSDYAATLDPEKNTVNAHGIVIASSNVTLDLNGFTIQGGTEPNLGSTSEGDPDISGILGEGTIENVTIRNGKVVHWPYAGILFPKGLNRNITIESVETNRNGYYGVGHGMVLGSHSTVSSCRADDNAAIGINTGGSSNILDSSASGNMGGNIRADNGSSVIRCIASSVEYQSLVGIAVGDGGIIRECVAQANDFGFIIGIGGLIDRVTASENRYGIAMTKSSSCIDSVVTNNGRTGILTVDLYSDLGGTLDDGYRFSSSSHCLIRGNTVTGNGHVVDDLSAIPGAGAGIFVFGQGNRILENHMSANKVGIWVFEQSTGNFLARNTVTESSQSNWDVAADNICLVVIAQTTEGAISGDEGGVSPGSTDPNTNFTIIATPPKTEPQE